MKKHSALGLLLLFVLNSVVLVAAEIEPSGIDKKKGDRDGGEHHP